MYNEREGSLLKAQNIHRQLVDAMRMLQMSHDGAIVAQFEQDSNDETDSADLIQQIFSDPEILDRKWQEFAKKESRKR